MPKLNVDLVVDDQGTIVVKKFAGTVKEVFSALGPAMLALGGGAGVAEILSQSVKSASDLAEVSSKFNTVFTGQTALAETWAQTMVDGYAMSTREARQYLSAMQDLLVPMGMNAEAAGKMSNEVVKLAADLGSFNNKETSQVMDDIQSALVGNYETMKKYGVVLSASVVEQEALRMGLKKTKDELTAADKAQAAYSLIVKGSQAAIGDMARTQDGYANQLKKAKATVEDITAAIGDGLQTELAGLLKWFNDSGPEIVMQVKMWATNFTKAAMASKEIIGYMLKLNGLLPQLNRGINMISGADEFHALAMARSAAYKQIDLLRKRIDEKEASKDRPIAKGQAEIDAELRRAAEILKIRGKLEVELEKLTLNQVDAKRAALGREMADLWQNYGQEISVRETLAQVQMLKELALDREMAEADKKMIGSKLSEHQKFYAEVGKQIKDNFELEKKAIEEISSLKKQQLSLQTGTSSLLADLSGQGQDMATAARYKLTKSDLDQQLQMAKQLGGQDQIAALERLKTAYHDLAVEYKDGFGGTQFADGKKSAAIIAENSAAIQAAHSQQMQTMADLTTAAEQQAQASRVWGVELASSAVQANNTIVYLQETLDGLDAQLAAMDAVVAISAQDEATAVVNQIQRELADLHDKTITITTVHKNVYTGGGGGPAPVLDSHALGTGFIPQTGPYELHYRESVNTAAETAALASGRGTSAGGGAFKLSAGGEGGGFVVQGDVNFHLPAPRPGASLPTGPELDRWMRDEGGPALRRARFV